MIPMYLTGDALPTPWRGEALPRPPRRWCNNPHPSIIARRRFARPGPCDPRHSHSTRHTGHRRRVSMPAPPGRRVRHRLTRTGRVRHHRPVAGFVRTGDTLLHCIGATHASPAAPSARQSTEPHVPAATLQGTPATSSRRAWTGPPGRRFTQRPPPTKERSQRPWRAGAQPGMCRPPRRRDACVARRMARQRVWHRPAARRQGAHGADLPQDCRPTGPAGRACPTPTKWGQEPANLATHVPGQGCAAPPMLGRRATAPTAPVARPTPRAPLAARQDPRRDQTTLARLRTATAISLGEASYASLAVQRLSKGGDRRLVRSDSREYRSFRRLAGDRGIGPRTEDARKAWSARSF